MSHNASFWRSFFIVVGFFFFFFKRRNDASYCPQNGLIFFLLKLLTMLIQKRSLNKDLNICAALGWNLIWVLVFKGCTFMLWDKGVALWHWQSICPFILTGMQDNTKTYISIYWLPSDPFLNSEGFISMYTNNLRVIMQRMVLTVWSLIASLQPIGCGA